MPDLKKLLMDIYNASSYDILYDLVHSNPLLSKSENWRPYGDLPNNCGTFEGQQATPEAALVEKITNSIDAILMNACMQSKSDPKNKSDKNVPKTMHEAIGKYFCVFNGNWENAEESKRREVAQNLQLIVSGDRVTPNIAIYDKGEGQNPESFPSTFLSLHAGNKVDIPFVQGKFNMGSTGAVVFCGGHEKYQLIVSRRNMSLKDANSKIGFTLVREHPLTDEEEYSVKTTWYEYLAINGQIPYFEAETLDFGLDNRLFTDGTLIKLYSYELSKGCRSDATLDLWRELNTRLYEASIPVLIYEKRDFGGKSATKAMLGNKTRISIDDRDSVFSTLSFSINNKKAFGAEIPIEVTIFNKNVSNTIFIRGRSMIFLMNGQTQGFENRTVISQEIGFRHLRDYMLVSVDCTSLKATDRKAIFMSSRDRMREGQFYNQLKEEIVQLLKSDDNLKNINQEYKGKELIETLFSKLKSNKEISSLLKNNHGFYSFSNKISNQTSAKDTNKHKEKIEAKKLNRFPSFLRVTSLKDVDGKKYKAIPKGGKGVIRLETDVTNDFLTRSYDKGDMEIKVLGYGSNSNGGGDGLPSNSIDTIQVKRSGPYNGEIKISFEPGDTVDVGDVFSLSTKLISADGEYEAIVFVKIVDEAKKEQRDKKKDEEPDINLPKPVRVFKEKSDKDDCCWEDCGMKASDIVLFRIGEKNAIEAILINMDSNLIKKQINKKGVSVEAVSKMYFSHIYAHSLMIYSSLLGYYSDEKNAYDLDKGAIEVLKEGLGNAIETVFQYYGGFLMEFGTDNDFLE